MNFIQIDGWAGAGKGVLWSLLDGHSDLFVNPIHDFSHCAVFNDPDILSFRQFLGKTEYYKLEKLARFGYDPIDFGDNQSEDNMFDFDFYGFDKQIANHFFLNDSLEDSNSFIDAYMSAFIAAYKTKKYDPQKIKYFASMGNYYEAGGYLNSKFMSDSKTIFVRRDVEGIIAARINRQKRDIDNKKSKQFAPSFSDLMSVSEVESIQAYNQLMLKLRSKLPDSIFIIDFERLVYTPQCAMQDIANFLNIEFQDILCVPTRDGVNIGNDNVSFIGKINDDPDNILSSGQRIAIKIHKLLFFMHRQAVNIFSMNALVIWAYSRLKKKGVFGGL